MKTRTAILLWILIAPSFNCFSQSHEIEITGSEGKRVRELASEYLEGFDSAGVAGFIYVQSDGTNCDYYFGLAVDIDFILSTPPSHYFFTSKGLPVFVYTGFEKLLKAKQEYRDEIGALTKKYLFQKDFMPNVHYNYWYLRFENQKEVHFTKRLDKRELKGIPSWLKSI